jgi:cytochrome b
MNMPSASPADAAAPATPRILVWDAPVRVFHWLMVISFAGAFLTAESERWRLVHVTLGYTMAGLVGFRLLWGVAGTRHARFASFVRGPAAVLHYLRSLAGGRPQHHAGHNPAGALAIVALLAMTLLVTATGWSTYHALGGSALEELHEGAANALLAIVGLHLAGVLLSSWIHRTNLVAAMVHGHQPGLPQDGVRRAWRGVAVLMLLAVLGFWYAQWQSAPQGVAGGTHAAAPAEDDDDR